MNASIEAIRYLASQEAQDHYIVSGTASECLLIEELVNDALEFVRLVELRKIGSSMTAPQRNLLAELKVALGAADTDLPGDELVVSDPAWAAVREAAQRFPDAYDGTADPPAG